MASEQLKVVFTTNQAELDRWVAALKKADINADELLKSVKKIGDEDPFGKMNSGISTLINGAKAYLTIQFAKELAQTAVEAGKVAAAAEQTEIAFKALGGTSADVKKMSTAVGDTASNVRLMAIAVKALQQGIDKLTLNSILEFADKQADATGKSLEEVANVIINSLGKNATKGLEQVGLSTKRINENVKTMGVQNAILKEMTAQSVALGDGASEAADSYDKLATSQENLQVAFGKLVNSTGFIELQNFLASGINSLAGFLTIDKRAQFAGMSDQQLVDEFNRLDKLQKEQESRFFLARKMGEADRLKEAKLAIIEEGQAREREAAATDKRIADEKIKADKETTDKILKQRTQQEKDHAARVANIAEQNRKLRIQSRQGTLDTPSLDAFFAPGAAMERQELVGRNAASRAREKNLADLAADVDSALGESSGITSTSEKVKLDFTEAAAQVFSLVDSLTSLGDSKSSSGAKFISVMQGLLSILSFIPGAGTFAQIGSLALGTFGKVAFRNQGGWIPGMGPDRDSVLAALTPGEFITKRTSAQQSPLLLDAINSGELDDKVFKRLTNNTVVNVDQTSVVEAIKAIPQVDLYKSGSALFEVRRAAHDRSVARRKRLMLG